MLDLAGNVTGVSRLSRARCPVRALAWNCEKFNMDEHVDMMPPNSPVQRRDGEGWIEC